MCLSLIHIYVYKRQYKDSAGTFINQEIVNKLKESSSEGIWIEYFSKNAKKRAYAQRVSDKQGNSYFIACGYYPAADRKAAEDLVGRAGQYMEAHGTSLAVTAFSVSYTHLDVYKRQP